MKNVRHMVYALLLSAVLIAITFLTHLSDETGTHLVQVDTASGQYGEPNDGGMAVALSSDELNSKPLAEMITAVRTLEDPADDIDIDAVVPFETHSSQIYASGLGGLSRDELMVEANRIMLALYQDGLLSGPSSFACAFADTTPVTGTAKIIIERFRSMHHIHLALVKRELRFGDQDSLTTRGWSQIRLDLARLKIMDADLRNETALVTR